MVATVPADRSMPPVSMVSVWQAASIASGMANLDRVAEPSAGSGCRAAGSPARAISASSSSDQRDQRAVHHQPPSARQQGRRVSRHGHGVRPRVARTAPNITTATMIVPSMMAATLGSTDSSVRSIRTSRRTKTARIGPKKPAAPAAQHHAAQHDGRDRGQQVGPGDRLADAGAHGDRQARQAPRTARRSHRRRSSVGPTGTPERKAASWSEPMA